MNLFDKIQNEKFVVVDNFLHQLHAEDILKTIFNPNFPVYYQRNSVLNDAGNRFVESDKILRAPQFTHVLAGGGEIFSDHFDMFVGATMNRVEEHFELQQPTHVGRVKVNLKLPVPNCTKDNFDMPHIDNDHDHVAMIYYVHDTDGDTFMFDSNGNITERISPKKNRVVLFDGSIIHAAGFPVDYDERCIINFNIMKQA